MSVSDERRAPFVWTTLTAIKAIREGVTAEDPGLPAVRSVYDALIEVANERRSRGQVGNNSDQFVVTREKIAAYAGVHVRTVTRAAAALERLGLLKVERQNRRDQAPSRYVLIELDHVTQDSDQVTEEHMDHVTQEHTTTKEETATTKKPPNPQGGKASLKKVNRKPVTNAEYELASALIAAFNQTAGTGFTVDAHLVPIVGRIREKPALTLAHHRKIIAAVFRDPWWNGRPTPAVIYGSAGQFENCIETARAASSAQAAGRRQGEDVNARRKRIRREQGLG